MSVSVLELFGKGLNHPTIKTAMAPPNHVEVVDHQLQLIPVQGLPVVVDDAACSTQT